MLTTFDCEDTAALSRFWASALGYTVTFERERLEALGATTGRFVDNGEAGQHYTMRDIEGNEFCLVPGAES